MEPLRVLRIVLVPLVVALPLAACSAPVTASSSAPVATASATSASQSPSVTPATASPSATPTPTPTTTVKSFSMAQVKQHGSAASCWSAVGGLVYDLTKWIGRHPGGRARIIEMCGKDGTATFRGEHGKERGPSNDLKRYLIGPLA